MLVLTRKLGESIVLAEDIHITVSQINGNRVRLSLSAPRSCLIRRQELQLPQGNTPPPNASVSADSISAP